MKAVIILIVGYLMDRLLGDPPKWPHPVVLFGKVIALGERALNRGCCRLLKGALLAVVLIAAVFVIFYFPLKWIDSHNIYVGMAVKAVFVFFGLAGTTLIKEVREVFRAVDRSLEDGRRQVARIVGRDTSELSAQEVRTAALETLAENLSDGVVAPLFWYLILGVPGMMTYKMVNTLDSMIGYRTERYRAFGCWAARIDDIANYLPARITALLMLLLSGNFRKLNFVTWYGREHASPNSGYPEAALACILNCRFGGPHTYFGELIEKPYIGTNERPLTTEDMEKSVRVNRRVEVVMVVLVALILIWIRFSYILNFLQ